MKILTSIILFTLSIPCSAQVEFLDRGFELFKKGEKSEAVRTWLKGGPIDGSSDLEAQSTQFDQVQPYYGNYISHEYVSIIEFNSKNKIIYTIVNMDKGPLYMRFIVYQLQNDEWTSPNFRYSGNPEDVWPSEMLFK